MSRMHCERTFLLLITVFTCSVVSRAEEEKPKPTGDPALLTVDRIYKGNEFSGESFSGRWDTEGNGYLSLVSSKATSRGSDIQRTDSETGETRVFVSAGQLVPQGESSPLAINDYHISKSGRLVLIYTNSHRVWRRNTRGDYWVFDRTTGELRQLGRSMPPASLMFGKLAPDGHRAAYVHERNIYVEDLRDGSVRCLTKSPGDDIINGTFDWVYEEEFGLRDGFRWSPDSRWIAFWQIDSSAVPAFPLVNNTAGLYPAVQWFKYPKTGQRNPTARIGLIDVASGKTRWLDIPGDPTQYYLARMEWTPSGDAVMIQQLNRLQNENRVLLADPATGEAKELFVDRDEAWINVHDEIYWLDDDTRFTWISERDGWRHVYWVDRKTGEMELATPGEFDVVQLLALDQENEWLYFIASPDNPTERYLYRCDFDGERLKRVTPKNQRGVHQYRISPNGQWAIHTWSNFDTPPTTDLVRLPEHKQVRVLAANEKLKKKVAQLRRQAAEFFRVDIGDGVQLDGWCLKPPLKKRAKYPLLVYVYGEPAGQTVLNRWGGSGYLWHLMLTQQGYVVMSFDNRGTPAPRGRQWRKCVYRQIGILAPRDQAAAVRQVLRERSYLDPKRVGLWGWSGGGSMTLNGLFKYPDLYHVGISIAPVPNQRFYDTIYQERYMGLPEDNAENYIQGSPIHFAHQLKGDLLLVHGTGDDNCHYQTSELLINELIRHNKQFTMMAYPFRTHSIREGPNTTRHLRQLMTDYLRRHLPPGPRRN